MSFTFISSDDAKSSLATDGTARTVVPTNLYKATIKKVSLRQSDPNSQVKWLDVEYQISSQEFGNLDFKDSLLFTDRNNNTFVSFGINPDGSQNKRLNKGFEILEVLSKHFLKKSCSNINMNQGAGEVNYVQDIGISGKPEQIGIIAGLTGKNLQVVFAIEQIQDYRKVRNQQTGKYEPQFDKPVLNFNEICNVYMFGANGSLYTTTELEKGLEPKHALNWQQNKKDKIVDRTTRYKNTNVTTTTIPSLQQPTPSLQQPTQSTTPVEPTSTVKTTALFG